MSDREDDRKLGINSSALFFGNYAAAAVGVFFIGTAGLFAELGWIMQLSGAFWLSLLIASGGWFGQYLRLRQPDLPKPVYGEIFGQNVWLGFILLVGMLSSSWF